MVGGQHAEANAELYLQLEQSSLVALETHEPLVAQGEWNRQRQTALAYKSGSALPARTTLDEFAAHFVIDNAIVPMSSLERQMLDFMINELDTSATQLLQLPEVNPLVSYLNASPTHKVTIAGRLLTQLATGSQQGGLIKRIELSRHGEARPALSSLAVRCEFPDGHMENAAVVTNDAGELLAYDTRELSPLMQRAAQACRQLFGMHSEAHRLLTFPPEDLEAAFAPVQESSEGFPGAHEVLALMRAALEEEKSNPVSDDAERLRLERLSAFVLSMTS